MAVFELPKQFHPDFAVPGKQPQGPVELDLKNKFAKNLVSAVLCRGSVAVDLVSNNLWTQSGTTSGVAIGGQGVVVSDNSSDQVYGPTSYAYAAGKFNAALTVVSVLTIPSIPDSTFRTIWSLDKNDYYGPFMQFATGSNNVEVFCSPENFYTHNVSALPTDHTALGYSMRVGQQFLSINGATKGFDTQTYSISGDGQPAFGSELVLNRGLGSTHHLFLLFSGAMPEGQLNEITASPYQVFKPAIPMFASSSTAALLNNNRISSMHFQKIWEPTAVGE